MRDNAMSRLIPPGSLVLFLFFLTGIWIAISPFVMGTQTPGAHWIASTLNNVAVGTTMIVVSLLGILGYMAFGLRDLLRDAQVKQEVVEPASQP